MSALQKQVLDVRLLGMDEKANPRESAPGTIIDADNCIMYKDGRVQKRPGTQPIAMLGRAGESVTYARELGVRGSEMMLNDGRKWWARNPVLGQWLPRGYSAYERLDIRPSHTTDAECNGIDSRLQMDSAVIGRYEMIVMAGGPTVDVLDRSGWMVTDHTTGALLVPFHSLEWYQWYLDTDGATSESFVGFGVDPTNDTSTTHTLNACVWDRTVENSSTATAPIITDMARSADNNTYTLQAADGVAACYDCARVSANVWLIAYHQYQSTGPHSRLVIRTLTRTSGATFTVGDATTVDDTMSGLRARALTWMYSPGNPQAWLAWESTASDFHCVLVTIATMVLGTPFDLASGYWDHCRGMTGGLINQTTPYVLLDVDSTEDSVTDPDREVRIWYVVQSTSERLLHGFGLLTRTFTLPNIDSNEFAVGVFNVSAWQPSAFVLRLRMAANSFAGSTVGAHLSAGDFAGRPMCLQLPHFTAGASLAMGTIRNQASPGGSGTVSVSLAKLTHPLPVVATPTPAIYPTTSQPVELAGTMVAPGAALKAYDGEAITEAAFYLGPEGIRASSSTASAGMEIGTREYTAVAKWVDAQGRIQRSQPCPPVSVTTSAADGLSVSVDMLNLTERAPLWNYSASIAPVEIEVYRTGVSDPIFYRVKTLTNVPNAVPATFTDTMPDSVANANEQLYTTGNAVERWPVIGCNLATVHQGRLFVATADGLVYFTAYAQDGEGLAFAAEYLVETEHVAGEFTALLSMDDKLVICTALGFAVLAGIGPEATGVPAYDSPMLVGSELGPSGPRGCVRIPDGVVMSTRHGPHLLNRGLSLQYIGPQVEDDAASFTPAYAALYHPTYNHVRLFGATKSALVYDWTLPGPPNRVGQWMHWTYGIDVTAVVVLGGTVYYLGHDATVYQADTGTADNTSGYQEWLQFTVVSPVGVNAWARVYAMRFAVTLGASAALRVVLTPDETTMSVTETHTFTAGVAGATYTILKPRYGKCSNITIWIGEDAASRGAGFTLDSVAMEVGMKSGLGQPAVTSRMTRSA